MAYKFDYNKECESIEWQKKSHEILSRDNYTCKVCGARDEQVQVHHTCYNQDLHYWEYPDHQLQTLCRSCHEKETILYRKYKGLKRHIDEKTALVIENSMKQGVPLLSLIRAFALMGLAEYGQPLYGITSKSESEKNNSTGIGIVESRINTIINNQKDVVREVTIKSNQRNSERKPSISERKKKFIEELRGFECKYDPEYLESFINFWTCSKGDIMRFEKEDTLLSIRLKNWNPMFEQYRLSQIIKKQIEQYEDTLKANNVELSCRNICSNKNERGSFSTRQDRLFSKYLYEKGYYEELEYNRNLGEYFSVYKPIPIAQTFITKDQFKLMYEAQKVFADNLKYNKEILTKLEDVSFMDFCNEYEIQYKLKKDRSIKELVLSKPNPLWIDYYDGWLSFHYNFFTSSHLRQYGDSFYTKFFKKLNEVFGLRLFVNIPKDGEFDVRDIRIENSVDPEILYAMDGLQFDFRDDSFCEGTMKAISLPDTYKDVNFYLIELKKIEKKLKE